LDTLEGVTLINATKTSSRRVLANTRMQKDIRKDILAPFCEETSQRCYSAQLTIFGLEGCKALCYIWLHSNTGQE